MLRPLGSIYDFQSIDCNDSWECIERVLNSILSLGKDGKISSQTWVDTFEEVYKLHMCYQDPYGIDFCRRLKAFLSRHVTTVCSRFKENEDEQFCELYMDEWENYKNSVFYIDKLCASLNRSNIKFKGVLFCNELATIEDNHPIVDTAAMHKLWYDEAVTPLISKIKMQFSELFKKNVICGYDNKSIKILRSFTASIFLCDTKRDDQLERDFIHIIYDHSNKINQEIKKSIKEDDEFLKVLNDVNAKLKKLLNVVKNIIPNNHPCFIKLTQNIAEIFILDHSQKYEEGFTQNLSEGGNYDIPQKIYEISKCSIKFKEKIMLGFKNHITSALTQSLSSHITNPKMICTILSSDMDHYNSVISKIFRKDEDFFQKLESAIAGSVHQIESKPGFCQCLASYLDYLIYRVPPNTRDDSINKQIKIILKIYTVLTAKNAFDKKLLYFLSKRIISKDLTERTMAPLDCLRKTFTSDLYSTIARMFDDFSTVRELNSGFKKNLTQQDISVVFPLAVYCVRAELWPYESDTAPITLPEVIQSYYDKFCQYYNSTFANRKLSLIHNESNALVTFQTPSSLYRLWLNSYQLAIFFLFNTTDSMSLENIASSVGIKDTKVGDHLEPFIANKILLLNEGIYTINPDFSSQKKVLKLNKFSTETYKPEEPVLRRQSTGPENDDQMCSTMAAIIRVFKVHEQITFDELMTKLKEQDKYGLSFDERIVKLRLEYLINRDFIVKKSENPNVYGYSP